MRHFFTITWFDRKDTVTKRIMRHLFCGLACLFLALPAMADSFTIGDLRYTVTNTAERTVTVEAVDRNISGDITIPEKVENDGEEYTVTSIKNYGFGSCSSLTSIKIPNSVTKIGQQAFRACVQLASVNIPNNITIIDYEVFRDCRSLTSVEIPESVITIASEAFYECNELASVSIPNSVTEIRGEAFKLCRNLAVVTIPNSVESIGLNAFYGTNYLLYAGDATGAPWGAAHIAWGTIVDEGFVFADEQKTKLVGYIGSNTNIVIPNTVKSIEEKALTKCNFTSVEISDSVTSIEDDAFTSCRELTSVIIPNSVTHIGVAAFSGCSKLTSIKIPNSITTIENSTFSGCSRLTSIEIPNTVKSIKSGAFQGCEKLNSINIPNSVTEIGSYAFQKCSSLTSIEIPDSITTIQSNTFYMCTSLAKITIPKSVTTIEENAFTSCKASSLFVPEGVTSIGEGAFFSIDTVYYAGNATGSSWGANRHIRGACIDGDFVYADEQKEKLVGYLGSDSIINIPDNVKIIGTNAFEFCTKINSINIPETVTTIEEYAFKGCTGLTEIKLSNSITQIGEGAFYNCTGLTSIGIPNSVISIGNKAFYGCSGMTSITLSNTLTSIGESAFWGCSKLISIKLPSSLTTIEASLFVGCTNLYNVTIPNTITTIGNSAFSGCSGLTSISIPSSVTSIGTGAFYNCSGLTSITIPNSVTSIGASAFYNCTRLSYVTLSRSITSIEYSTFKQCSKLSSITIPNSVTKIENYAFEDCTTLTYINIPDSVTYIGSNAFNRVKLTSVVIPPSVNYIGESALNGTGVCFYTGNGTFYSTGARRFISKGFLEGNFIYADEQKEKLIAYVGRNTSVTIPNNVKSIEEDAFINEKTLTNIIIPNSVTSIGESSFRNCTGLISVTIPKSVISIGWHAFNGCVQLSPFHIPATVDTIGAYAFQGLDTIYYAGTASGSPWSAKKHVKGGFISGDFVYADEAKTNLVAYLGKNANVIISNSVTSIDAETFNGFETVYYEGTATGSPWGAKRHIKGTIFDGDFVYADEAKTNLVAYLGKNANVIISNSVTSIDAETFNGFETVYYEGTATGSPWGAKRHIKCIISDGDFVYADEEKTELIAYTGTDSIVTIPETVTSIGSNTFHGFETVYYAGTVTGSPWGAKRHIKGTIFDGDFVYADEAKTNLVAYLGKNAIVIIPNSVTSIDAKTFNGFETVYYGGAATGSPWGAKRHIKGTILDGDFVYADEEKTKLVAYLGKNAIVIIPNSVTSIDAKTFNGFETVYYGGSATGSPWGAKQHIISYIDGDYIYVDEGKTKIAVYTGSDSVVVIPEQVKTIGDNVFNGNTKLISVTLPDSITSIGNNAFSGCTGISSLTIPVSVTSIGKDAFSGIDTIYYQTENGTILIIKDFYVIHNLQEFLTYRNINNKGYHPNGRLDADIDLSPVCGIINGEIVNWETINLGDAMFDGGNHTITNLYINRSVYYIALLNGRHIENLTVKNAYVKGTYAAGITSCTSPLLLVNCHFEGVVIGSVFAGALNLYGKASQLVNCSNYGLVISSGDVKQSYGVGIYAQEPINCYNRGRIINWEGEAHGIGMYCCDSPTNCYNAGAITAKEAYSIFEAHNNCFNLKIEGVSLINEENIQEMDSSAFLSGAVTDSLNKYVAQNPKTFDRWTIEDSIPLLPWVQGEDGFPRFEGVNLQPTQGYVVRFKGAVNDIEVSRDGTIALPVSPDGYTYIFANDFDGKNIVSDTTVTVSKIGNGGPLKQDGDGFYLIHNGAELAQFRDMVNEGAVAINGRLANDIDLSQECKDSVWIPIGVYKNRGDYIAFEGVFDGAGHAIEHLYDITDSPEEWVSTHWYRGLFGNTKNATIQNVVVKNSRITGFCVSAIVASAENTTILNCGSEAELYGYSDYGAAPIRAISEGCRILNCYNIGDVKCEYNALGFTNGGEEIINCYTSCVVLSEGGSSSRFGDGRVVYRCFADTVLSSGKYDYENKLVTMTSTDYIKSDAFLADMNAWVDSMNAAQSEIVFARWVRDEVDGYPKLQPTHTSVSLPDVRRATPDGISVYAVEGTIYIRSAHAGKATLYDIHGKAVASVAYAEGITTIDGLASGLYVLKGIKVIVK